MPRVRHLSQPLAFIRKLLEIGADPNLPVNDGFPPLIAAPSCAQETHGANRLSDVTDILKLLLQFGADPNQRGINDYTPLHMAVAVRDPLAVRILLDAGADPQLRTRIDNCCTRLEMATAAGLNAIADILTGKRRRLSSGLTLLADMPGTAIWCSAVANTDSNFVSG